MAKTITTRVTPKATITWTAMEGASPGNSVWHGTVGGVERYTAHFARFDAEGKAVWRLSWSSPQAGYWNENLHTFTECRRKAAIVEQGNLKDAASSAH